MTIGVLAEHALLLRDFANTVDVDEGSDALADPAALAAWLRDHRLIPGRAAGAAGAGRHGSGDTDAYGEDMGTHGGGGAGGGAVQTDLEIAIALRDCLRAAMREHHQRQPGGSGAATKDGTTAATRVTATADGTTGPATAASTTGPMTAGTTGPMTAGSPAGPATAGTTGPMTAGTTGPMTAGTPAGPATVPGGAGAASALELAAASLPLRVAELAGRPALVPVQDGVRGGLAWLAAAIVASTADGSWERLKICADDTCQWAFLDSSKNRSKHWCSMQECGNRSKTRAYRARRGGGRSGE